MAYLLSNIYTQITGIGQLLLKLWLVVGWYPFFETQCRCTLWYCAACYNEAYCGMNHIIMYRYQACIFHWNSGM